MKSPLTLEAKKMQQKSFKQMLDLKISYWATLDQSKHLYMNRKSQAVADCNCSQYPITKKKM